MKISFPSDQKKSQSETITTAAESDKDPAEINSANIQDPIIDILRDEFEFEDDYLVLFSASKCGPGPCPDC